MGAGSGALTKSAKSGIERKVSYPSSVKIRAPTQSKRSAGLTTILWCGGAGRLGAAKNVLENSRHCEGGASEGE